MKKDRLFELRYTGTNLSKNIEEKLNLISVPNSIPWMRNTTNANYPSWYRAFWMLASLTIFCFCCFQLMNNFDRYLNKSKQFQTKIMINQTVYFPAISLCFQYTLGSKELRKAYEEELQVSLPYRKNWTELVGFRNSNVYDVWNSLTAKDLIQNLTFPLANLVRKESLSNIKRKLFPTYFGICETIDLSDIEVYYEFDSLTYFRIQTKSFREFEDDHIAFRVVVHSPLESKRHQFMREGVDIHYKTKVNLILSYQRVKFLDTKEEPCLNAASHEKCMAECYDAWLLEGVSCRMPYVEGHLPYCKDKETTLRAFELNSKIKNPIVCPQCSRKCITDHYVVVMTPYDKASNFSEIHLLYEQNVFRIYEEVFTYSRTECISDAGCILGLYLGFSIVNVFQLLDSIRKTAISIYRNSQKI